MTRIVAGRFAGRQLRVPAHGTRPTSERVREALFSILTARGAVHGAVLDLYAGSGALGFEALSRGAEDLTVVDSARAAVRVLRSNAHALAVQVHVQPIPVEKFVRGAPRAFDLVFVDPPYAAAVDDVVRALARGWLAPGATVVLERDSRSAAPALPLEWEPWEERRYGETTLWLTTFADGEP